MSNIHTLAQSQGAPLVKGATVAAGMVMGGDLFYSRARPEDGLKPDQHPQTLKTTLLNTNNVDLVEARDNGRAADVQVEVFDEQFKIIEEAKQNLAREIAQVDVLELVLKRMEDMRDAESSNPESIGFLQSLLTQAVEEQAKAILSLRQDSIKRSMQELADKVNQREREQASWWQTLPLFELVAFSDIKTLHEEVHSRAKPGPFTDAARVRINAALDLMKTNGSINRFFKSNLDVYKDALINDSTPMQFYNTIKGMISRNSQNTTSIFNQIMSKEEVDVLQHELSAIVDMAREEFYSVNIDGMFDEDMPVTSSALVEYMFEFDNKAEELKQQLMFDTTVYQELRNSKSKHDPVRKKKHIQELQGEIKRNQEALRKLKEKAKLDVMTLVYEAYPRASWAADCIIYSHNSVIDDSAFVVKQIYDFATGADLEMPYYDEIKLQVQEGLNATRDHILKQAQESAVRSAAMAAASKMAQSTFNNLNDAPPQTDRSADRRLGVMKPANTAGEVCNPCTQLEQAKKDNQETQAEIKKTNKLLEEVKETMDQVKQKLNASYFDYFRTWMKVETYHQAYKFIKWIWAQILWIGNWTVEIIARYFMIGPYSLLAYIAAKAAAAVVVRTVASKMCPRARANAIKELENDDSVHSKMLLEEMGPAFESIPAAPVSTLKKPITATHIKALHKKSKLWFFSASVRDTMVSAYEQVTPKLKHHPFALPLLLAL